jgi:hypothetical protein
MPLFASLVLLLDIICIGHAVYKRQPALWFFVIVALPFVGATMYLTVENRKRLADALVERGRHAEARELYESALTGAHEDDPALTVGLARALFGLEDFAGVRSTLDRLREALPEFQSPEAHMLYARALDTMGKMDRALMEYEALATYFPGEEARCRHGMLLLRMGREQEAEVQFRAVVQSVESGSRLYQGDQKVWYDMAKQQL